MSVLTLILAGGQGSRLSILGEKRAKPAVPFGGKYRIIDFPLSNAVNSDLYRVAVLTQYRPHSLMQHIGIGEPWDLNRTRPNGVEIWQPYQGRKAQDWYRGTADALYQNRNLIAESGCDQVLVLSGDHIYKQDYREMLRFHADKGAALTVAVRNVPQEETFRFGIMDTDASDRIVKFTEAQSAAARWLRWASMSSTWITCCIGSKRTARTHRATTLTNIIEMVDEAKVCVSVQRLRVDVGTIQWETNLALLHEEAGTGPAARLGPPYTLAGRRRSKRAVRASRAQPAPTAA